MYDFSDFVNEHPGKPGPLLESAGKDGTSLFNEIGSHDEGVRKERENFRIGKVKYVKVEA